MNRTISVLGSVAVVASLVSLLSYAGMGLFFIVYFGTPDAFNPSNVSGFITTNQEISSNWLIHILINPNVLNVMVTGWAITFMWGFLHAFGLSYTMLYQASANILKNIGRAKR